MSLRSHWQNTMITRRRSRAMEMPSVDVEEVDVAENDQDLPSPSDALAADDIDHPGIELDDLFEDLKWTLEKDSSSLLFGVDLANLEACSDINQDSGFDASSRSSPDRTSSGSRMKNRQNQSNHVINKNAIAARLNRLKKKEHVNSLEKQVGVLSTENAVLKQENCQLTKRVEELEDETRYLRAVLANESMLAQLLSRLSGVNGMKLSSSLFQGPRSNEHDYALPRKRVKVEEKETSGGVCLHVDKNHVSVEFCPKCAESASTSLKM
ncbi:PREDICTED: CREB/ATF bZIP transcription factor isoform X2 [Poecilia mexicana]|nr:PREDICTED: CREB/ATF bZIP transcription factor isoform X2 [Poecilia mexicana]